MLEAWQPDLAASLYAERSGWEPGSAVTPVYGFAEQLE